ncbi:MAG: serine/threonine protein kinase [Atopobiaceae bacterium]|nr:serine/threonine protein kinase [Atopobiaceae bacterium]
MDDNQTLRSMVRDDAYHVVRVLSDGPSGRTELVTFDGEGPLVRKHIPAGLANASAWAVAMEADEPLLPRIESLYRMPDELVVVYEYVQGESLSSLVEERGPLPADSAMSIVRDVCRAVAALHERGVVHRDITPGNVIVAQDGAHLVDLGIARQRTEGRRRDTTTLGTWGFAAPEQYGFAQTDARSDVYSLGRLLGYALTGAQPDSDEYEARLADPLRVPTELAEVVHHATAFEPSARYQSAAELSKAVCEALDTESGELRDGSFWAQEPVHDAGKAQEASRASVSASQPVTREAPADSAMLVFAKAPLVRRILALLVWVACSFLAAIDLWALCTALTRHDPPWDWSQDTMAIVLAAGMGMMMREAWLMVSGTGAYANAVRPIGSFLIKECIIIAKICMCLGAVVVLYTVVSTAF